MKLMDRQYLVTPFYGSRRMTIWLQQQGYEVNRKRVMRLMRVMGLEGQAPGPNTSKPHPEHKVYPYLLRDVKITRVNQVWSTDITYIPMKRGFMYLTAVMDWYSRYVLYGSGQPVYEQGVYRGTGEELDPYQYGRSGQSSG